MVLSEFSDGRLCLDGRFLILPGGSSMSVADIPAAAGGGLTSNLEV